MARLGGVRFSIGVGRARVHRGGRAHRLLVPSFVRYDNRTDPHAIANASGAATGY